jgi:hypothetical protein
VHQYFPKSQWLDNCSACCSGVGQQANQIMGRGSETVWLNEKYNSTTRKRASLDEKPAQHIFLSSVDARAARAPLGGTL